MTLIERFAQVYMVLSLVCLVAIVLDWLKWRNE
jgi:hypothetical protein